MILTCHDCPRQLCFRGSDREGMARAFGWMRRGGGFVCGGCGRRDVDARREEFDSEQRIVR